MEVEYSEASIIANALRLADVANYNRDSLTDEMREIVFSDSTVGFADFLHLNISLPNRELVGLRRVLMINEALKSRLGKELVNVVYDAVLPRSDASREGGGYGFLTGVIRRTWPVIREPEAYVFQQKPDAVQPERILTEARARLSAWNPECGHGHVEAYLKQTIVPVIAAFNEASLLHKDSLLDAIVAFKRKVYETLSGQSMRQWLPLSRMNAVIASVLRACARRQIPWYEIPVTSASQALFHIAAPSGKVVGHVVRDGDHAVWMEESSHTTLGWDEVINELKLGRLVPSVEIYVLSCLTLPRALHFGNLYGRNSSIEQWMQELWPRSADLISRITPDNQNSVIVGTTDVPTRYGYRTVALLTVDLFLHSVREIREAVIRASVTGSPSWTLRDFKGSVRARVRNFREDNADCVTRLTDCQ